MNARAHRTRSDWVSAELATEAVIASYIHRISTHPHVEIAKSARPPEGSRAERRADLSVAESDARVTTSVA